LVSVTCAAWLLASGVFLLLLLPGPAVGLWCETEVPPERPGEVALVEEACFMRDLRDCVLGVSQPPGGPGEPQGPHIGADWCSVSEAEDPGQMYWMHADRISHFGESQLFPVLVVQ
jgi:hypothetical protein